MWLAFGRSLPVAPEEWPDCGAGCSGRVMARVVRSGWGIRRSTLLCTSCRQGQRWGLELASQPMRMLPLTTWTGMDGSGVGGGPCRTCPVRPSKTPPWQGQTNWTLDASYWTVQPA
jgi:hypothetical protein